MDFQAEHIPTEIENRIASFGSFMPRLEGKRIVIYGTGKNAQGIVRAYRGQCDFVCVVGDADDWDEDLDIPVLSWEQALAANPDTVVVAANAQSTDAIFRRIRGTCIENGLPVYDLYGSDLELLYARAEDACLRTWEGLLHEIAEHDVVCLDALSVMRAMDDCAALPDDARRVSDGGIQDYEGLACAVLETGAELVLIDEAQACYYVDAAHLMGAAAVIDCKKRDLWKTNGAYRLVKAAYHDKRIMHIGPNRFRDVVSARMNGIDGFLYGSLDTAASAGAFESTPSCRIEQMLVDVLARADARESEAYGFGYKALGPMIAGHVLWLVEALRYQGGYEGVLFAARDAYLSYKAYELYRSMCDSSLPEAYYFLTSRKAALGALADRKEAQLSLAAMQQEWAELQDLFAGYRARKHELAVQAFENRVGYMRYCDELGLRTGASYAFVDFLASGTAQRTLQQFLPYKLHGYYVARGSYGRFDAQEAIESYLPTADGYLARHTMTLEALASSVEPSVDGFGTDGKPIFEADPRSTADLQTIREVGAGALAFCACVFKSINGFTHEYPCAEFAEALLARGDIESVRVSTFNSLYKRPQADKESEASVLPTEAAVKPLRRRTVHSVLLGLLAAFDTVCEEFGLTYIASHGTLLGAVRHGGFVPWDDDLDVAMPRADYDRLLELAEQGVFPEPFFLQTPENDPACFYGGYAKLRDSSTSAIEPGCEGLDFNQGIWMDILPLDNCPTDDAEVESRQRIVRQIQRVLYAQTYKSDMGKLWDAPVRRLSAYYLIGDHISRESLCRMLRRACTGEAPTGTYTVFASNYRWTLNKVRYDADDVACAVRVPFEDTTIPIPRNADAWLAARYGDNWGSAPDLPYEERQHEAQFDPNLPYTERLGLN